MATKVYDTFDLELENGETITIKPLPIKYLRKFMEVVAKIGQDDLQTETAAMDIFLEAAVVCLKSLDPKKYADSTVEDIEDILTVPTMMKILEIAGGLKSADPNLLGAALNGEI